MNISHRQEKFVCSSAVVGGHFWFEWPLSSISYEASREPFASGMAWCQNDCYVYTVARYGYSYIWQEDTPSSSLYRVYIIWQRCHRLNELCIHTSTRHGVYSYTYRAWSRTEWSIRRITFMRYFLLETTSALIFFFIHFVYLFHNFIFLFYHFDTLFPSISIVLFD